MQLLWTHLTLHINANRRTLIREADKWKTVRNSVYVC